LELKQWTTGGFTKRTGNLSSALEKADSQWEQIFKCKEAIRIISNAGYRDHTIPLFKEKRILPLDDLIKYSILKFMHKFAHGKLPLSFHETWITNRLRNPNLELRNADHLYIPAHLLASVKRFPVFNFPGIWNEAADVKNNPSIFVFQKSIKSAHIKYAHCVIMYYSLLIPIPIPPPPTPTHVPPPLSRL
jgi:hypothetical protein